MTIFISTMSLWSTNQGEVILLSRQQHWFILLWETGQYTGVLSGRQEISRAYGSNLPQGWAWCLDCTITFSFHKAALTRQKVFCHASSKESSLQLTKEWQQEESVRTSHARLFWQWSSQVGPPLEEGEEVWYLPLLSVSHPKKNDWATKYFRFFSTVRKSL